MNITSVAVIDPRKMGEYRDPYLRIEVDDAVEEQGDPIYSKDRSLRVIPCGLFFAVESVDPNTKNWTDIEDFAPHLLRVLNTTGTLSFPLVAVTTITPEGELPLYMALPRLRRLIRRMCNDNYKLVVNEYAAINHGGLEWRFEDRVDMCYGGATPRQDDCRAPVVKTVRYNNTHLPLCEYHARQQEKVFRNNRTKNS